MLSAGASPSACSSSPTTSGSPGAPTGRTRCGAGCWRRQSCRKLPSGLARRRGISGRRRCALSRAPAATPALARGAIRLGRNFVGGGRSLLLIGVVGFAAVLLADLGLAKFQALRVSERRARLAALETMALAGLRGNIQSIASLGEGRYELTLTLWNVSGDRPIYVMSPSVQAYVQVGRVWQEIPLRPAGESTGAVLKITGKQAYRYVFEARLTDFARLLPHYMHVRFREYHAGQPAEHPPRRSLRAEGQLLRLPEAVERGRSPDPERAEISRDAAPVDPDAAAIEWRAIQTRPLGDGCRRSCSAEPASPRRRSPPAPARCRRRSAPGLAPFTRPDTARGDPRGAGIRGGWPPRRRWIMVLLAMLGVGLILANSAVAGTYWIALVPLFGLLCVVTAWARARRDRSGLSLIVRQVVHWLGIALAVGLDFFARAVREQTTWPRA